MEQYCICGHLEVYHYNNSIGSITCFDCADRNIKNCTHNFKLDNLRFIEDLAKEKNLI
jgi:hypothetical protein